MLEQTPARPARARVVRAIKWQDDRNAANHADYLDFARRATDRQADRMLRLMPIFPDAPEIIVSTGNLWMPERRIACANEYVLAEELRRLDDRLDRFKKLTEQEEPKRPETERCADCMWLTCGPNITTELIKVVEKTKAEFPKWDKAHQDGSCEALSSERDADSKNTETKRFVPLAAVAWDIDRLFDKRWLKIYYSDGCAGKECYETAQVNDQCYYCGSINYVIFGVMCKLCDFSKFKMNALIESYKGKLPFRKESGNYASSKAWAGAGYDGWPKVASPPGDRAFCYTTCPLAYPPPKARSSDYEFKTRWYWVRYLPSYSGTSNERHEF